MRVAWFAGFASRTTTVLPLRNEQDK